jgi:glycerol-3-phosphate dehydrogenase
VDRVYDIAIIGGGINGCGIARDAAGRGHSVFLCEQGDLASGTSSAATKLIHGGLRYLEYNEFRLVREALQEREVLWRIAPHLIRPLRFVLPLERGMRPPWLLRLGLFLYDHLGGRRLLPPTKTLDLARDAAGAPLRRDRHRRAFEFSDCFVDDARLVVLNAQDAAARGATVRPRAKLTAARRDGAVWRLTAGGDTVVARCLVNAAGPWVGMVLGLLGRAAAPVRLVQGSHLVFRRLFAHDRAYLFQNPDGRVLFAIPYEDDFTLIGTTDTDYAGDPGAAKPSEAEIDYLCAAASAHFATPVTPDDVVWSYCGVRPLYDDGAGAAQAATRDYVLALDADGPPLLSVFGGKITTYRRLAEHVLEKLAPFLPASSPWTGGAPLPGGDFPVTGVAALEAELARDHPHAARRLARAYGTRARQILCGDRGRDFGAGLSEAEVRYLMRKEWAMTPEDVIWRRTKLGLRLSPEQVRDLAAFMRGNA